MTPKLSHLASALIDDAWILCSPPQALLNMISQYREIRQQGLFFHYGSETVSELEFLRALEEVIAYFDARGIWMDSGLEVSSGQ